MARRPTAQLRRITAPEFAKRMRRAADDEDHRFAFFLGAGTSVTSGIPAAGSLVRDDKRDTDWLRTLKNLRTLDPDSDDLDDWARKELPHWNPENPGASYGDLIENLFLHNGDRQREIERICDDDRVFPNFGYAVLSGLMCGEGKEEWKHRGTFSVALTTNFDDVLVDAFFYFRQTRPLVIHHDSLAPFIRPTQMRPMIVKLHGDHQLAPRNTAVETSELNVTVQDRVSSVLHDRGLVFIGYGGADESIIAMLESLPEESLPFGVYWVSGTEPRGIFRQWLESRDAVWVEHRDFDELMLLLMRAFEFADPNGEQFQKVLARYHETKTGLLDDIAEKPQQPETPGQEDVAAALKRAATWARTWESETHDPDQVEQDHLKLIEADPENPNLLGNFAFFLSNVRKDPERAQGMYERAIKADPEHAINLGNFAFFLSNVRKDPERAQGMYERAIKADPEHANNLGNFANFLTDVRKDHELALEMYERAIKADPENAHNLGNFAVFLKNVRKDHERAQEMYERAIKANPGQANHLGNFANFLKNVRKDYERAQEMYERAIKADPENAHHLGNFAVFLSDVRKDHERALEMYERAIKADPKHVNSLANFAKHLFCIGDLEKAQQMLARARAEDTGDRPDVTLEMAFYLYAHGPASDRADALAEIRGLLDKDVRSPGWDLSGNVQRAVEDGFRPKTWLKKLAAVISDGEPLDSLEKWAAWQKAAPANEDAE